MRAERSGRDGPGPALRGGSSTSRGRSSFNDRDGGRPMVMGDQVSLSSDQVFLAFLKSQVMQHNIVSVFSCSSHIHLTIHRRLAPDSKSLLSLQPFSSGRQVVVERHSREQGLRKEWHGGSSSQGGGFADNRRMGDTRGGMMAPSRYTKFTNK